MTSRPPHSIVNHARAAPRSRTARSTACSQLGQANGSIIALVLLTILPGCQLQHSGFQELLAGDPSLGNRVQIVPHGHIQAIAER